MKVLDYKTDDVQVSEMQNGDIAVITSWGDSEYIGKPVKRYMNHLIDLGSTTHWDDWFNRSGSGLKSNRVRILPKGTKLEI